MDLALAVQCAPRNLGGGRLRRDRTRSVGASLRINPLRRAVMALRLGEIDDLSHAPDKTTTAVAMEFGRITLDGA